jgi:hypothetical protein
MRGGALPGRKVAQAFRCANAALKRCATFCRALAAIVLVPAAAAGQQPLTQGPMVIERLHSGFVVAPDFKVTEVDRTTSALAGGSAGWLTDKTFFIGGGGYWLANQASDRKMAYGGLVLQLLARTDRRVGFGVKGLIGGGRATLGTTVTQIPGFRDLPSLPDLRRFGIDLDRSLRAPTSSRVRFSQGFFVAEPQVDVMVGLTRQVRLTGGAGYRLVGAEGRDDRRLRGATGSLGLQIGGGS